MKKEFANIRAKLEAKDSELEAVRLRLTDAEKGLTKSRAEADALRASPPQVPLNRDEDQVYSYAYGTHARYRSRSAVEREKHRRDGVFVTRDEVGVLIGL